MKLFITAIFLTLFSFSAHADPIQDGIFKNFSTTWIKSVATSCKTVCKNKVATAETEGFWIPGNNYGKNAYVCKSQTNVKLPNNGNFKAKGTLYGTNLSHSRGLKTLCLIPTHTGIVQKLKNFHCLCIRKRMTLTPRLSPLGTIATPLFNH